MTTPRQTGATRRGAALITVLARTALARTALARTMLVITTLALTVTTLTACGHGHGHGDDEAAAEELERLSEATVLRRLGFEPITPASRVGLAVLLAQGVAPPEGEALTGPAVDGRIVEWLVRPGDAVAAGQPLALVTSDRVSALAARVSGTRRDLQAQRALLERAREEVTAGYRPRADLEALESTVARLEAESHAAAREQRAVRTLAGASTDTSTWAWTSPISGVVARLGCSQGASVQAGEPCAHVVDPALAAVRVAVPQQLQALVTADTRLTYHPEGAATPIDLRLLRCAPVLDPASRTRSCDFVPDATPAILIGSSGTGRLHRAATSGELRVPELALVSFEGQRVVFVRRQGDPPDALPEPVPVVELGRAGSDVIVRPANSTRPPPIPHTTTPAPAPAHQEHDTHEDTESSTFAAGDQVLVRGVFLLKSWYLIGMGEDGDGHGH